MTLDYNLAQLDMLVEAGLDVLVVEDDIAGQHGPLISPAAFTEFVNAYNRQIVERAHDKGLDQTFTLEVRGQLLCHRRGHTVYVPGVGPEPVDTDLYYFHDHGLPMTRSSWLRLLFSALVSPVQWA